MSMNRWLLVSFVIPTMITILLLQRQVLFPMPLRTYVIYLNCNVTCNNVYKSDRDNACTSTSHWNGTIIINRTRNSNVTYTCTGNSNTTAHMNTTRTSDININSNAHNNGNVLNNFYRNNRNRINVDKTTHNSIYINITTNSNRSHSISMPRNTICNGNSNIYRLYGCRE